MERSRSCLKGTEEESLGFVMPGHLIVYFSGSVCRQDVLWQDSLICLAGHYLFGVIYYYFFLDNSTLGMILLSCRSQVCP